jgi:hypothetical protein
MKNKMRSCSKCPRFVTGLLMALLLVWSTGVASASNASQQSETSGTATAAEPQPHVGVFSGQITDRKDRKPIAGARVVFTDTATGESHEAVTDKLGRYEVKLPIGVLKVEVFVNDKRYLGAQRAEARENGTQWTLDFYESRKVQRNTTVTVGMDRIDAQPGAIKGNRLAEGLGFLGGLIAVGVLAN